MLNHAAGTVSLFKKSARFLKSILVGIGPAVSTDEFIIGNLLGSLLVFKLGLSLSQLVLVVLDGSLGVSIGGVCPLKSGIQFKNIILELLLHSESLSLALGLSLNGRLHVLKSLAHVLFGSGKLFILLNHAAVNFLSELGKLKLAAENLVLFLLKSSFSLRKSSLELHLLSFNALADFVNVMDGSASFADLIHDVLDLIGKSLVLPADFVQLENSF